MTSVSDWSGRVGDVWASEWWRTERAFGGIARRLDAEVAAVAPAQGRAIDIGCGAGSTTVALAILRPGLAVTGIDLSPALVGVAKRRAGPDAASAFVIGDARSVAARLAPVDCLVSRHGVMFFVDPLAAFAALRAAAAPGAPFVFSCFRTRAENDWAYEVDAAVGASTPPPGYVPGPFGFADPGFVGAVLAQSGWVGVTAVPIDVPFVVGGGADPVADGLTFLTRIGPAARPLADAAPAARAAIEDRLRTLLSRHRVGDTVTFTAAAWIWTAFASTNA